MVTSHAIIIHLKEKRDWIGMEMDWMGQRDAGLVLVWQ